MPKIKSAKKALRQTIKRTKQNRLVKIQLKTALKKATAGNLSKVQALIDKAAKKGVIHANKAGRFKSQLMRKLGVPKKSTKVAK